MLAARSFSNIAALEGRLSDKLAVIVEELVSNILRHGASGGGVSLQVKLEKASHRVQLEFADDGVPFDPINDFKFEGPARVSGGGAGLELVRTWAHELTYQRDGQWNRLRLLLG